MAASFSYISFCHCWCVERTVTAVLWVINIEGLFGAALSENKNIVAWSPETSKALYLKVHDKDIVLGA